MAGHEDRPLPVVDGARQVLAPVRVQVVRGLVQDEGVRALDEDEGQAQAGALPRGEGGEGAGAVDAAQAEGLQCLLEARVDGPRVPRGHRSQDAVVLRLVARGGALGEALGEGVEARRQCAGAGGRGLDEARDGARPVRLCGRGERRGPRRRGRRGCCRRWSRCGRRSRCGRQCRQECRGRRDRRGADRSGVRLEQAGRQGEQRRLADPVRADDGQAVAGPACEGDIAEDGRRSVGEGDVGEEDRGHGAPMGGGEGRRGVMSGGHAPIIPGTGRAVFQNASEFRSISTAAGRSVPKCV